MGYGANIRYDVPELAHMASIPGGGTEANFKCGYQPKYTNCNCTGFALKAPHKVGEQNALLANKYADVENNQNPLNVANSVENFTTDFNTGTGTTNSYNMATNQK